MVEFKRTPARHRLLQEVSEGGMQVYQGLQWNLVRTTESGAIDEFLSGAEKRTGMDVMHLLAPSRMRQGSWGKASLSREGEAVLEAWNARHGTPAIPSDG